MEETNELIYVVRCSSGSWEESVWWIGGIFTKKEDAIKVAEKLNLDMERKKATSAESPIKKSFEEMTEEELEIYDKWTQDRTDAEDWRGAKVLTYDLNKML